MYGDRFKGFADFLGVTASDDLGQKDGRRVNWVSYDEARKLIQDHKLGIKSAPEWAQWSSNNKEMRRQMRMPSNPR